MCAPVGPMLEQDGSHFNARWGYLSRAGLNDKSQLCRQIEKYADIYTSRVSNFLRYTPYMYFRYVLLMIQLFLGELQLERPQAIAEALSMLVELLHS